ncbi:MAG: hypothetical protein OJF50_006195 [Nitrospira sp.]|nr:hypothetical protein [Nitrospira sp.]
MPRLFLLIVLCSRCVGAGLWSGAYRHPAFALAFHRRAASIMPARRYERRLVSRSFLRIAPARW